MKVLILCGGKGTRLREGNHAIPKGLVEIGDMPIVWHVMRIYAHHGFREFVLCLGYKGEEIKAYFRNGSSQFRVLSRREDGVALAAEDREEWEVTFADTGEDTNTGGRIKLAEPYVPDDLFMVTYGDGVSDMDIATLLEYHRRHGRLGTVTVVNPSTQFGILHLDEQDVVTAFVEKPRLDHWVNGGFFVFHRKFLDYLDADSTLEREPLQALAADRQLVAYRHRGYWACMDTYKDTLTLNEMWAAGGAPWKVW